MKSARRVSTCSMRVRRALSLGNSASSSCPVCVASSIVLGKTLLPTGIEAGERITSSFALLTALHEKRGADLAGDPWVLSLDQEVSRARVCKGFAPCVVPRAQFYMPCLQKMLHGKDYAALQGLPPSTLRDLHLDSLTEFRLRQLCGNAFSLPVVMCAMVSALLEL